MLEATIITPIEDFPKVSVRLAESEKFMSKEFLSIEELENYYPETKLDTLRQLEVAYEDFIKSIPEPKERFGQKLARTFKKMPVIEPIFNNWDNLEQIEEDLLKRITNYNSEIQELKDQLKQSKDKKETDELVAKGIRLLEIEYPYDVGPNDQTLIGILTTTKIEDAEEFCKDIRSSEVILLVRNKFLIFAQGKKGEISKLSKNLSVVRWVEFEYKGSIRRNKFEIEEEILNNLKLMKEKVEEAEARIERFAIEKRKNLMALKLSIESYKHLLYLYLSSKRTKKTVILQGWVAEEDTKTINKHRQDFQKQ